MISTMDEVSSQLLWQVAPYCQKCHRVIARAADAMLVEADGAKCLVHNTQRCSGTEAIKLLTKRLIERGEDQ